MSFKIPQFISKNFNARSKPEREKYIEKYKQWHSSDITQDWIKGLEARLDFLIQEEEKQLPSTEFEFKYQTATNRAERVLVRSLIKELQHER